MREITNHRDGHALTRSIVLMGDEPGTGGASHHYTATIDGKVVADVQFQSGPRNEPGSIPGVTQSVLLAIVEDTLQAFQDGPYACEENEKCLSHVREALTWQKYRADQRAARGVLGTVAV